MKRFMSEKMAKTFKRCLASVMATCMVAGFVNLPTYAAERKLEPNVTVMLMPGETTSAKEQLSNEKQTVIKTVTAQTTAITTNVNNMSASGFSGTKPYLKFDRNDTANQKENKKIHELYTDNGHFHDTSAITVTDAPVGYPFQFVGYGDYSGHYVSKVRVIYERNEDGTPKVDENGNYIIKELQHSKGATLTYKGESTLNINGPFDQTTGTRPQHFLLMNEAGEAIYAYCNDLGTGVASGNPFYAVANLEDAGYYASKEAAEHIRAITQNGYWGTESGAGSVAQLKENLKAAVAAGEIEKEYDITFVVRIMKKDNIPADYEMKEGEYIAEGYLCNTVTEHIVLTDEVIDGLTGGEAIDATQAAIWSYANGSNYALDGTDRMVVGDITYASSAMGDSLNGQNDFAGAARTKALYNYLMNLQAEEQSTVVINEKNFIKDMSLSIGNHMGNGVYAAAINFTTCFAANVEKDDLAIVLTYVDAEDKQQSITRKLTGEDALMPNANGFYTLEGLELRAGQQFEFTMKITGAQFLERNTYILTAEGGTDKSQTMVSVASGYNTVDIDASFGATFAVEEQVTYHYPDLESDKTAKPTDDSNRFEINIEVPGGDAEKKHDEIILMVDGSYSMDNEWPAMKNAITEIGKTVLDGSGHTVLTLMAFGMGDNEVLVHVKTVDELVSALGELPGNLLYGRSSTNCEAGFTGVAEYIENHDETLGEVSVIFISDGNVNTDETPRAFDANWQTWATKFGALTVAQAAFEGAVTYGENLPAAFTAVFGDRFDGMTGEEILTAAFTNGEVTDEEFLAFAEQLWTDVYAYSGLTRGVEYPVSDAERAFVKYDKEKGTYIQDLFYYTTYKSAYVTYGDRWTRTPAAAEALAAMDQVKNLYVVDYDSYTAWMDTGITNEKATFVQSNGIAGLLVALEDTLTELSKTPYNDVVVTDYMSKWVLLDPVTIHVVDGNGNVIAEFDAENSPKDAEGNYTAYLYKWVGEALCENKAPVVLELVSESEYEAGGADVIGNVDGPIYRITWNLKDGPLMRNEAFKLQYEVIINTEEPGFEYNKDYPANGNTYAEYIDGNGEKNKVDIKVPEIVTEQVLTEVTVNKTWEDDNDQDGIRPESITIRLHADGVEVDSVVVTEEMGWSYTFENLNKFANGEEIVYTITEDEVPGYTTEINGFDVTNTHAAEQTQVSVEKVWDDDEDFEGKRPESITIRLFANGEEVAVQVVTAEDGWTYTFENLPAYADGQAIVYTVTEDAVEGYEMIALEGDAENGFKITNQYLIVVDDPEPPTTGDPIALVLALSVISVLGMAVIALQRKKFN